MCDVRKIACASSMVLAELTRVLSLQHRVEDVQNGCFVLDNKDMEPASHLFPLPDLDLYTFSVCERRCPAAFGEHGVNPRGYLCRSHDCSFHGRFGTR